ncbi:MAG: histidine kinase [Muricauda sp.]|nr:histidine kinase [Allomuricauda sp.]MBO6588114.1 histidine kinase [Allomuricauda sp.]MBO6617739.1 histidine kinase [Allomuricauda sp.]MBO6643250.1 histidine kinase [Allomuricauda sp.]MBO6746074.1 histidine kinase [Allomuricauda sp.]
MGKENEEDILWDVAKNCIAKLGFVDCVVYLVNHNNVLIQKAAYGPKNPKDRTLHNPVEIPVGHGITGAVAKTRQAELIVDTSQDPRYIEDDDNRLSEICVPITYEDQLYGVIDCEHPEKGFFTERHLKMLSAIASICAIKIKSVRANLELLEKQDKLFQIREEMMELKLKALNSQLNPHFIFNSLNAIQYFITAQKTKLALDYFSTFSRLVRYYLKQLGEDTTPLYHEIDMLHWYLKLQKLRYDDSFAYTISIEKDNHNIEEAIIPSFIILMLFENIVEQSSINQEIDQHFHIDIKSTSTSVILKVEYHCKNLDSHVPKNLDYREDILKWKDQVRLLNTVKGYSIAHQTSSVRAKGMYKKSILLQLPNLV